MTINVTQENIYKGAKLSCLICPIAFAARDAGFLDAEVHEDEIMLKVLEGWEVAELPDNAIKFISDFDSGKPVQPFSFEIEI